MRKKCCRIRDIAGLIWIFAYYPNLYTSVIFDETLSFANSLFVALVDACRLYAVFFLLFLLFPLFDCVDCPPFPFPRSECRKFGACLVSVSCPDFQ